MYHAPVWIYRVKSEFPIVTPMAGVWCSRYSEVLGCYDYIPALREMGRRILVTSADNLRTVFGFDVPRAMQEYIKTGYDPRLATGVRTEIHGWLRVAFGNPNVHRDAFALMVRIAELVDPYPEDVMSIVRSGYFREEEAVDKTWRDICQDLSLPT